jgi:hypothetical protein
VLGAIYVGCNEAIASEENFDRRGTSPQGSGS